MIAEFLYRALTAGFYGAISQQFRRVTPAWRGTLGAIVLVPAFSHLIEFCIHSLRGTPNLKRSIAASVAFSLLSVLFNLHIMRNGAIIVGREGRSFADDMRAMPGLILSFLLLLPRALVGLFANKERVL